MFLVNNLRGHSVLSASVCTLTVVGLRHQKVKEIIPMGRLERKLSQYYKISAKERAGKKQKRKDWR
jgi:hypothetical protein